MKYCMQCGNKTPTAASFCPSCGTSLKTGKKAAANQEVEEDVEEFEDDEEVSLSSKGLLEIQGNSQPETLGDVVNSSYQGYERQNLNRGQDKEFANLSRDQISAKLKEQNKFDGPKEIK